MIKYLFEHGRLQALIIALLCVSGLAAISSLPITEDPRITNRFASVTTFLPGASAERIEAQLSEKLEQKLKSQQEVKLIISTSRPGISVLSIELNDNVQNPLPIWSRLRDLLADVQSELPAQASTPLLDDEKGYAYTRIFALTGKTSELPLTTLSRYAKELQSTLRNVSGVEIVHFFGKPEEEILVEVNAQKAALSQISIQQIALALQGADAKVAAGTLTNQHTQIQLEITGAFDSISRIQKIPLISNETGAQYQLSDLAKVQRAIKKPEFDIALIDGKKGIYVAARMLPGLRIDNFSKKINTSIALFSQKLPEQVQLKNIFDQKQYTENRLGELVNNILVGFVIILSVLLLTLGFKAALIVGTALPLTVLFTLVTMQYYGLPIHQMSVTGLVVALGIMVDNAIVMTDSIQRYRQQGYSPLKAVQTAVSHFWMPLLGSTLTTILAFAPIVLMPGPAGEFVGGIALSVIFALIGSYLISHTLIAVFAGQFINGKERNTIWGRGIRLPKLTSKFQASLKWTLMNPKQTLLLVFILPVLGFLSAGQLTEQFFPPSDRDMFHIEVRLTPSSSITNTKQTTLEIDKYIRKFDGIEKLDWMVGNNFPSFYYNMKPRSRGATNYAQAMVKTPDFETANKLIPKLQTELDKAFPQAQIIIRKLEQGPPFNAPIEMRIYGPNLDTLNQLGLELRTLLTAHSNVIQTRSTLMSGNPKLWLKADEIALKQSGLTLTALANQLQSQYHGIIAGSIIEHTETIPVRVRVADIDRSSTSALNSTSFVSSQALNIETFTELTLKPSRGSIERRNGERVNVIEGYLKTGIIPQTVLNDFQQTLANSDFKVPPGYRLEIGGESQKRNEAVGQLITSVGIIIVLLLTVLVVSFNSFTTTLLIMVNAAQAAMLGLLSVYLGGFPFGFTVIIALLGLMGLAINASIVILSELRATRAGTDQDKIIAAVMKSSRHITSTTITTVGGFMPLILAGGGFWPPFAVAIAGGTALTTILSFYFVPVAFKLMMTRKLLLTKSIAADSIKV
ncbi:efflux RND transporter permease subunit [Pseudoalteromonas denitrificans]|uniref:Multidrug efflux pump subunit AcrB n=1 Tax=Pseudoalteromonas denitrificans DSM 6059 TaxID=1123010 RepID=A0A1I1EN53_9GAMM|nr:efflux RND transporter permease subunit [Pseudoalteromonas denitrificans]SFB88535.1 Multidrug efflux pump subunit AcrB [Pseudoalteromonas denitrificans DSM 6059]